jgi:hypothetical protein
MRIHLLFLAMAIIPALEALVLPSPAALADALVQDLTRLNQFVVYPSVANGGSRHLILDPRPIDTQGRSIEDLYHYVSLLRQGAYRLRNLDFHDANVIMLIQGLNLREREVLDHVNNRFSHPDLPLQGLSVDVLNDYLGRLRNKIDRLDNPEVMGNAEETIQVFIAKAHEVENRIIDMLFPDRRLLQDRSIEELDDYRLALKTIIDRFDPVGLLVEVVQLLDGKQHEVEMHTIDKLFGDGTGERPFEGRSMEVLESYLGRLDEEIERLLDQSDAVRAAYTDGPGDVVNAGTFQHKMKAVLHEVIFRHKLKAIQKKVTAIQQEMKYMYLLLEH